MARILSQNRWPVYTSGSHSDLVAIPHVTGRVRSGAPAIILGYVVEQFHRRVEPVRRDWSWGYAYRPIRGKSSGYSNHASATAVDTNAPRHPLGASGTFTPAQLAQIVAILAECEGTVRWGGTYSGRKDEMHWELDVPPNDPRLARVAAKLGALSPGLPSTGDKPTPSGGLTMAEIDDIMAELAVIKANTAAAFGPLGGRKHIQEQARSTAAVVAGNGFERPIIERNAEAAARHTGVILDAKLAALRQAEQDIRAHGVDEDMLSRIEEVAHRGALSGAKAGTEQALDSLEATVTIGTKEA